MAFTKQQKNKILSEYESWLKNSQAVFVLEYSKMKMKDVDALRAKVREVGGQLHVVKNTLMGIALKNAGIQAKTLQGTCLCGFAISDAAALAKVFSEATRNSDILKVKVGFLSGQEITPESIKSLAELPPLPTMRARLLGLIQTPAGMLVRTLAEPARAMAYVVKAYSEKDAASTAA